MLFPKSMRDCVRAREFPKMYEGIVCKQGSFRMWEGAVSEQPNQETEERWPLK